MSARQELRTGRRWVPALARVITCAVVCCIAFPAVSYANDGPWGGDGSFGSAAMQLRRLPPTATSRDLTIDEDGKTLELPVSFSSTNRIDPVESWNDFETRLYLGYDRGFVIGADQAGANDAAAVDFLMRVNSWLQVRHSLFESTGPNADQNTFSFERARLSFGGHVLSQDLQYFLQIDGNSDRSTEAVFLDYFVTYDLGRELLCLDQNRLGLKLGKWKMPFSRSREESGRRLQFTDRATANVFFDLNRSMGVGLTGELASPIQFGPLARPVQIETAVFNGFQTGNVSTNRSDAMTGLDRNLAWSLRAYTDLLGVFGNDGEPDLSWHDVPALRLGGGLAFTRVDAEGPSEFSRQRVVDSGATLSSILPANVSAYDVWLYTIDAHLKYQGFSFIADYYWRHINQFSGAAVPSLFDDGFVLQAGYFVVAEKLELITRWSRIRGNSGTLSLSDQSSDEIGGGVVWYIKGQNVKLTFDATHLNGVPVSSSRLDMLPGDAGWLFRSQFQLAF